MYVCVYVCMDECLRMGRVIVQLQNKTKGKEVVLYYGWLQVQLKTIYCATPVGVVVRFSPHIHTSKHTQPKKGFPFSACKLYLVNYRSYCVTFFL